MSTPAILIIPSPDVNTAIFSPSPQTALVNDLVFWNNETEKDHWPWPTDSSYNMQPTGWFPDPVPPGETSGDFATPTSAQTVHYCCKIHPKEHGIINVVNSLP